MQNLHQHNNILLAGSRNWQLANDIYVYGGSAFVCGSTEKDPRMFAPGS